MIGMAVMVCPRLPHRLTRCDRVLAGAARRCVWHAPRLGRSDRAGCALAAEAIRRAGEAPRLAATRPAEKSRFSRAGACLGRKMRVK